MRIISAYYTHKPGGFCKRLYRLLTACANSGIETHYYALDLPPPESLPGVLFHKIPFPLQARKGLLFWLIFTLWCPLYLLLASIKARPDRMVAFGSYYAAMFLPSRIILVKPLILFFRSLVFKINRVNKVPKLVLFFADCLEQVGARSANRIVCMTNTMRDELISFLKFAPQEIKILPNDIPLLTSMHSSEPGPISFASVGPSTIVALVAGVLDVRKNVKFAIEACLTLTTESDPQNIVLFVAGAGPELTRYKQLVEEAGAKNIFFLGWQEDLTRLFAHCNLLIHPATHEGMSNTILEALAADLPILAADTPEMREFLIYHQLLFPLDDPNQLSSKLESLRLNPDSFAELRELSQKVKSHYQFDWGKQAVQIIRDF